MAKYIIVSINPEDVPKKVPASAKLKVNWITENIYQGSFFYKEGSLNEGTRDVRSGLFNSSVYKTKKDFINEIERRKEVYSKNDFNNLSFLESTGFISTVQAEMAIRKVLSQKYRFKEIFDGSPFAKFIDI